MGIYGLKNLLGVIYALTSTSPDCFGKIDLKTREFLDYMNH